VLAYAVVPFSLTSRPAFWMIFDTKRLLSRATPGRFAAAPLNKSWIPSWKRNDISEGRHCAEYFLQSSWLNSRSRTPPRPRPPHPIVERQEFHYHGRSDWPPTLFWITSLQPFSLYPLPIDFMQHSSTSGAKQMFGFWRNPPKIILNPNVCYFVYQRVPPVPFLSQMNPVHIFPLFYYYYYYYYYYWYSALEPVWAETRAQSGDWYGFGTLHPGQVLRGSLPLISPAF